MIATVLLAAAAVVGVLAPRALVDRSWVYRSPLLGLTAWYAVLFSVTAALGFAAASLVIPWPRTVDVLCSLWRWCADVLHGGYGFPSQVAGGLVVGLLLVLIARAVLVAAPAARAVVTRRARHREAVVLVGRRSPELGVTVLEDAVPAAYLVPGRGHRIVVTTGAVRLLSGDELAAVVAHERAHAAGRHHLLCDGARLLERAFPRIALFAVARRQIARLVEMRADQVAGARHAPITLARALVAMAAGAAAPSEALAATGGDALERVHRMLHPPARLPAAARVGLLAAMAAVAMLPLAMVAVAWAQPALAACLAL